MMSLEKKAEAGALPPTKESLSFILKVPAFLLAVEKKKKERERQKNTKPKTLPTNVGDIRDVGLIPGSGRSSEGGHGNPLQYSRLENSMDRGPW